LKRFITVTMPTGLLSIVALAAVVEMWTRATWDPARGRPGLFLTDFATGERLAPNYTGWFAGVPVHINSLGFRDSHDYDLRKGPRTVRILVLGDSVTFGHGSVYEHTYPFLVNERLKRWRPDIDWQVWNLAVPGFNTAQELAQLREIGPAFAPDQVVVGFFENDVAQNDQWQLLRPRSRLAMETLNEIRRHMYSFEWYRRRLAQLRYRLFASDGERALAAAAGVEQLLAVPRQVANLREQALTSPRPVPDEDLGPDACPGPPIESFSTTAFESVPGFVSWRAAVAELQRAARAGEYRIAFFINLAPRICQTEDIYDPRSSRDLNEYLLRALSDGTPAVSVHDAFARYRPSDMPMAGGHSIGNANAIKADVLFDFLRQYLLPPVLEVRGLLPHGQGSQKS